MCEIVSSLVGLFAGAAPGTAASIVGGGAAAGAASAGFGATLANIGTLVAAGGSLVGGIQQANAAEAQAQAIEVQKVEERRLNAIRDQRSRDEFASQIRRQSAQIGARGFSLDSPTAVFLGQTAAEELAFQSQSIRQTGSATQRELSDSQRALRARARNARTTGTFSAAGTVLRRAPQLFPELLS